MTHQVKQTRRCARQYKKLNDNISQDVDQAITKISIKPKLGERKKGGLADLYVYKFKSQGQLYLLGYTVQESLRLIYLEAIGSHENFYHDIKS